MVVKELFGIPIAAVTMPEALALAHDTIQQNGRLRFGMVNAAKLVHMQRDRVLKDDVIASDVILADGMSVLWAGRLLGRRLPERIAGIDLMVGLLEQGDRFGYRAFFLGAERAVLDDVVRLVRSRYPGIAVAGARDGYFSEDAERAIVREIADANADLLFVAMPSPRKEDFMARWSAQLATPICHGVGGAFDVLGGKVRRAPTSWQRLGLEWLYRLKQEPRRLWKRYLVTNMAFCGLVVSEALRPTPVVRRRTGRAD